MVPIHKMQRPAKKTTTNQLQSSRSSYGQTITGKPEASRTLESARGSYTSSSGVRPGRYGQAATKPSFDLPTGKLREQRSVFGDNSKKYSVASSHARLGTGSRALMSQRVNSAMSSRGPSSVA